MCRRLEVSDFLIEKNGLLTRSVRTVQYLFVISL